MKDEIDRVKEGGERGCIGEVVEGECEYVKRKAEEW